MIDSDNSRVEGAFYGNVGRSLLDSVLFAAEVEAREVAGLELQKNFITVTLRLTGEGRV